MSDLNINCNPHDVSMSLAMEGSELSFPTSCKVTVWVVIAGTARGDRSSEETETAGTTEGQICQREEVVV